jgi:hypothetical protein
MILLCMGYCGWICYGLLRCKWIYSLAWYDTNLLPQNTEINPEQQN